MLVIIVNYRTPGLTIDCLRSLESEVKSAKASGRVQVIVTDNASGDDSIPRLQTVVTDYSWSDWVTIQALERNGGFAYGNNAAIRQALRMAVK